ncbi:MAG: DUF3570 domain-containing protein [Gammaproteobacteria bacterium]|nr:DUF3570 domain-containing protein [Gammaproteobacteria bacterium]
MQLKNISLLLSAATSTLLAPTIQAAALSNSGINVTTAFYAEENGISVNENILQLRKEISESDSISVLLQHDTMTGSSPSGAIADGHLYTTTTASNKTVQVSANETPHVPFADEHYNTNLSWDHKFSASFSNNLNASYSVETDYQSTAAGDMISKEFNNRMTTISAGASLTVDDVVPSHQIPLGLTTTTDLSAREFSATKTTHKYSLGISHILDRRSIIAATVGQVVQQGYLTDPYKIISYISAATGLHRNLDPYYNERRPDSRVGNSLTLQYLHQFSDNLTSINASYQYYQDDWQINTQSLAVKLHIKLSNGSYIEPEGRIYQQTAADFYHYALVDGPSADYSSRDIVSNIGNLDYASADYRLGSMQSYSVGGAIAWPLGSSGELKLRGVYLEQQDINGRFDTLRASLFQASMKWDY